jgi:hypothetical protein
MLGIDSRHMIKIKYRLTCDVLSWLDRCTKIKMLNHKLATNYVRATLNCTIFTHSGVKTIYKLLKYMGKLRF